MFNRDTTLDIRLDFLSETPKNPFRLSLENRFQKRGKSSTGRNQKRSSHKNPLSGAKLERDNAEPGLQSGYEIIAMKKEKR